MRFQPSLPHGSTGMMGFWKKDHRGEVPCPQQDGSSGVRLTLITWLGQGLPGFSTALLLFPLSPHLFFGRKSLNAAPHSSLPSVLNNSHAVINIGFSSLTRKSFLERGIRSNTWESALWCGEWICCSFRHRFGKAREGEHSTEG